MRPVHRCLAVWFFALSLSSLAQQQPTGQNVAPHELFGGVWRVDHSFQAKLRIRNVLVTEAITVTPVLYMADGTEYVLAPVELASTGMSTIDINQALRQSPPAIGGHSSTFGSVGLRFQHAWNAVVASINNTDTPRSFVFIYPLQEFISSEPQPQSVNGLWWKHDADVGAFTVLTNCTSSPVTALYQVIGSRGTSTSPRQVTVGGHATAWLDIGTLLAELPPTEQQAGGIVIHYTAALGALAISGGMENAANGYSAMMRFSFDEWQSPDLRRLTGQVPHGRAAAPTGVKFEVQRPSAAENTLASVGLMVGKPNPLEGFPEDLRFTPYAVVRNITSNPMQVRGALNLVTGLKLDLGAWRLSPGEARQLALDAALYAAFANFNGMVNLTLTHSGSAGDLLVATGSVNQTGNYSFEVAANSVGPSGGQEVPFWSVGEGYDTMITVWNSGAEAEDLVLTLYHGNQHGSYKMPIQLAANASSTISLLEIMNAQQPDAEGHQLPLDVRQGSATIASARGVGQIINVSISAGTFNAQTGTCGNECHSCSGMSGFSYAANPFSLEVTSNQQLRDYITMNNGTPSEITSSTAWSSSNTAIGTIGTGPTSPGLMHGVGSGYSPFSLFVGSEPLYMSYVCNASCPYTTIAGGVTGLTYTPIQHSYPRSPFSVACHISQFFDKIGNAGTAHRAQDVIQDSNGSGVRPAYGTPVYAMEAGTVTKVIRDAGPAPEGFPACQGLRRIANTVHILSADGYTTRYVHVLPLASISVGQSISQGQQVGTLDNSGCQSGAHLHAGRYGTNGAVNFTIPCVNPLPISNYSDGLVDDDVTDDN